MGELNESVTLLWSRLYKHFRIALNLPKCKFDQPEIEFFGIKFSAEGMSPTQEKVEALLQVLPLTLVAEVLSFLGTANYCANFIQGY